MSAGDKVSFKTPKGRELVGKILLRADAHLAIVTEQPPMTFIVPVGSAVKLG